MDAEDTETYQSVAEYTMTSPERVHALCSAVRYVTRAGVPGAIVECGVWRGGSMMAAARTLLNAGVRDRALYLFDTFQGMPPPEEHRDVDYLGREASHLLKQVGTDDHVWGIASLRDVTEAVLGTGYPQDLVHFIEGRVEETIPERVPDSIAVLRLDTDWYESTKHELQHLFPRLSSGGVLIIDDYGHWRGARQAVDQYFEENDLPILLTRVDYSARMAIKR